MYNGNMENNEALKTRIETWMDNARRNIANITEELRDPDCPNPSTLSARQADYFAKLEAWREVLRVMK